MASSGGGLEEALKGAERAYKYVHRKIVNPNLNANVNVNVNKSMNIDNRNSHVTMNVESNANAT